MSIESLIQSGRRMLSEAMMDSAWIHDRTVVRTPGGATEAFVRRRKATECRFGTLTDYEMAATANTTFGAASAALTLPHDTVIEEGDRVEAGADASMWLVVGRLTPPTTMATAVRVLIREL